MTPDPSLLSGFARGVLFSLHARDTCLHSGSWLLSGFKHPSMDFSDQPITRHLLRGQDQLVALVERLLQPRQRIGRKKLLLIQLRGSRGYFLGAVSLCERRPRVLQPRSLDPLAIAR